MSSADAVSLCLNGIDGQINALDQNARHLATSNDVEAAREQAREAVDLARAAEVRQPARTQQFNKRPRHGEEIVCGGKCQCQADSCRP